MRFLPLLLIALIPAALLDLRAEDSAAPPPKVLFFSKSSGFEHSVIKKTGEDPSYVEKMLGILGTEQGIDFTFTKDGSIFTPEKLAPFDVIMFYTTGDLTSPGTDATPPMPAGGKDVLLEAVARGKGFVGVHCASDTFHSLRDKVDPFIAMLGGEFSGHGAQQKARMLSVDPKFPRAPSEGFEMEEEWYSQKNLAPDLHVILVQETDGMQGRDYQRPPYPATWARMHEKGRVFYTGMGHREDVWTSPIFQNLLIGGILWAAGKAEADVTPNISAVTPKANQMPDAGAAK